MSNIKDLDVLAPPPVKVRLGGTVYKLPGDMPVPLMLKIEQQAGREIDEELLVDLYHDLLGLFCVHQPDLAELPVGITQLLTAIPFIYNHADDEDQAAGPPPPPPAAAGTTSTSARKPKAKRSRS